MPKSQENGSGFNEEEQKLWEKAMTGTAMDEVCAMRESRRRREWEETVKEEWPSTQAGKRFTQLAETFIACKELVGRYPHAPKIAQVVTGEQPDMFTMLRDNLEKANQAPRCEHQKSNGQFCRAPKMRGQKYCCMHLAMEAARPKQFNLPALDDANAIQVAITKGAQGLVDGTLEEKRATKLAYYLQLAMSNVGRVDFEPAEEEA